MTGGIWRAIESASYDHEFRGEVIAIPGGKSHLAMFDRSTDIPGKSRCHKVIFRKQPISSETFFIANHFADRLNVIPRSAP